MPRLIVCRNCTESDCTYCNVNILAVALERGHFNPLMGEQHTVQIDSELVPVRHGRWINHYDDLFPEESTQECSVCHAEQMGTMLNDNYCPNCGAKMDERREDETD